MKSRFSVRSGAVKIAARSVASSCSGNGPFPVKLVFAPISERSAVVPACWYDPDTKRVLRSRRREIAPAVLVEDLGRGEDPEALAVRTGVGARELAVPRAVQQGRVRARIREPGLGLQRERPAQRVETEDRVRSGDHVDRSDRVHRDEIPVDRVAERLVQADAVEVHRQALRRAEQRGREEAAVLDIRLQRIALHVVDVNAADRLAHVRRQVEALVIGEILGRDRLDVRRHVILGEVRAVQRRRRGHVDDERLVRVWRGRRGCRGWRAWRVWRGCQGCRAWLRPRRDRRPRLVRPRRWRRRGRRVRRRGRRRRIIGARRRRHQHREHRGDRSASRVGHRRHKTAVLRGRQRSIVETSLAEKAEIDQSSTSARAGDQHARNAKSLGQVTTAVVIVLWLLQA